DRVGARPTLIGVRKVLADVAQAGGAEQGIGDRVRDHVGVAVAGETALVGKLASAEDQSPRPVVREPVDVEALAHTHERHRRSSATRSRAQSRSSGTVNLRLSGSPGTTTTRPPMASTSDASSVPSDSPRWARRNTAARNACGVCTATREARA